MKYRMLFVGAVLALTAAACGGSNPAEPSSTSATVNGSIVPAGGSASTSAIAGVTGGSISAASTTPPGLLVSVAGTAISASVDAAGHFSLKNVPPGLADLRFTAPGISAALGLSDLKAGQIVEIQVSLTSDTATVESDRRASGREEQLEGRVESLPPTTAAGTFVVAGRTVTTDANTKFFIQGADGCVHESGDRSAGAREGSDRGGRSSGEHGRHSEHEHQHGLEHQRHRRPDSQGRRRRSSSRWMDAW